MLLTGVVSLLFSSCLIAAVQFEGENCILEATNEEGQCIMLNECEYAKKLLREDKIPETCGFSGNVPLVCCPVKQKLVAAKPGKLAQEKCEQYYRRKKYFPGVPAGGAFGGGGGGVSGIYLGQNALPKEFPHMAAVGYEGNDKTILWLCGGTFISNNFVLSAAHCAYSLSFGPPTWIRLGDLDLDDTTEDANLRDVRISQIYVHPQYKPSSHYHDIVLFKMKQRTYFGPYFKAACLQVEKNLPGNDVQATGWGKFHPFGEDGGGHLMKVNLNLVDHGTCVRKYANVGNHRKLQSGIIDDTLICAGNKEGGDTCPGASGGPLHYRIEESDYWEQHFVVAGVTSFGKGCGQEDSAGVYTRVSAYVGWIENMVWGNKADGL